MSTKTSIKRIAAVAAVALTLGGFTAVSAHAANAGEVSISVAPQGSTNNFGSGSEAATETITATAGTNNYIGLIVTSTTANPVAIAVTGGTAVTSDTTATGSGTAALLLTANGTTAVNVPTPIVGSIVLKTYKFTGGVQSSSATTTLTITVAAAATGVGTLSTGNSKAYITSVANATASSSAVHNVWVNGSISGSEAIPLAADVAVLAAKGTAGTSALAGAIYGVLKDSQTPTAAGMTAKVLTATISGSGLLTGKGLTATDGPVVDTTPARVATTITSTSNPGEYVFNVYSDGTAGTGTVTISYTDSSNVTTVVATKTITFYGAQATFTPTVKYAYVPSSGSAYPSGALTSTNYAVKIAVKDSAQNAVAGITPLVKSADTTIISGGTCSASSPKDGTSYCSLTGVSTGSGKVTVTFYTGATTSFDLVSTTADITVSSTKANSFVVTADASVSSGQIITYTITAADSKGLAIPDGTSVTDYMTSPVIAGGAMQDYSSANANTVSTLFVGVTFSGGVAKDTVQAPFGTTSIVATFDNIGGGKATVASSKFATLALTNAETVVTTAVGGTSDAAAQAAVDAAQEATDAANAAYDAANNAMDSADAATAAAQDASDNAAAALAAVTSLSATVAKLVASVSAITTALASIKKKLGVK